MKKVVVTSSTNIAGMNIINELEEVADIHILNSSIVELAGIEKIKADLYIVPSTHRSASEKPTLTAHTPGNFGPANLGGEPGRLSVSPALYVSEAVRTFARLKGDLQYDVSLEVTHHGPSVDLPIVFVEVGSAEKQWNDERATGVAAKVVEHLLDFDGQGEVYVGVGGPHYAPGFTRLVLKGFNIGHICPKYAAQYLDRKMLEQMVEKTVPDPKGVVLDWKGLPGAVRQAVREMAAELGIPAYRIRDLERHEAGK